MSSRRPSAPPSSTATRPKSARFGSGEGETRIIVGFSSTGEAKSTVALEHARLAEGDEAGRT
jgi:hypothetical protein